MKSKYIKIFMIFAIAFTLLSALFVSPNVAFAADEEETVITDLSEVSDSTIKYDLQAIETSTPKTAIISFPVTWESVYGNIITWSVEENQQVITYDEVAHWMVVDRSKASDQPISIKVNVKNNNSSYSYVLSVTVPTGETAAPHFEVVLDYGYAEENSEENKKSSFTYKLGDPTYKLEEPERNGYYFNGWYDENGVKVENIYVGSMKDYTLTAQWVKTQIKFELTNFENVYYDGQAKMFSVEAYAVNGEESTLITDAEPVIKYEGEEFTGAINANVYKVTVSINSPLYGEFSKEFDFEIKQATNAISEITFEGWTYGEDANSPLATANFGTVEYEYYVQGTTTKLENRPTDAGSYYVKAVVAETENYAGAEKTKEFTIAQATNAISEITFEGWTYGEDANSPLASANFGTVVYEYYVQGTTTKLEGRPTDAGSYYVKAVVAETANYAGVETTKEFTIAQASNSISEFTMEGWTYGEDANSPLASANFGTVEYEYYVQGSTTKLEGRPTDAGSYYVKAVVAATENYAGVEETKEFTISKLELTNENELVEITVLGSDYNTSIKSTLTPGILLTYDGKEVTSYNELEYSYAEGTVGTATITITLNGNYEGILTATFEVTEFGIAGEHGKLLPTSLTEEQLSADALPVALGAENETKSVVSWISSNSVVVVNPLTGEVTINKQPLEEDAEITLTATVRYATTSVYIKEYQITIVKPTQYEYQEDQTSGIIAEGADSQLTVVTDETEYTINDVNGHQLAAYDINFAETTGTVTIRIPIPTGYENSELLVYHIVAGSDPVDMEAEKTDGYLVFESNSFSPYVVIVKTYTVKFYNGEQQIGEPQVVESGKLPTAPENNPTKDYTDQYTYEFSGWDANEDGEIDEIATVTSDVTYKAVFEESVRTYTIYFVSEEETIYEQTVQYGSKVTKPTDPTLDGYTFEGWLKDGVAYDFDTEVTGDVTLTASWAEVITVQKQKIKYTADFNTVSKTSTSYGSLTTTDGWSTANCAIFSGGSSNSSPKFSFISSSESDKAFCMNGKTSAVGTITSPLLNKGLSSIKFNYGLPFKDTKIKFKIDIIVDENVILTKTVENANAVQYTAYEFEWVLDNEIEGEFEIKITNLSPSNSGSNSDRTAIWNLEYYSYE